MYCLSCLRFTTVRHAYCLSCPRFTTVKHVSRYVLHREQRHHHERHHERRATNSQPRAPIHRLSRLPRSTANPALHPPNTMRFSLTCVRKQPSVLQTIVETVSILRSFLRVYEVRRLVIRFQGIPGCGVGSERAVKLLHSILLLLPVLASLR